MKQRETEKNENENVRTKKLRETEQQTNDLNDEIAKLEEENEDLRTKLHDTLLGSYIAKQEKTQGQNKKSSQINHLTKYKVYANLWL